jgi:hypothetical protein
MRFIDSVPARTGLVSDSASAPQAAFRYLRKRATASACALCEVTCSPHVPSVRAMNVQIVVSISRRYPTAIAQAATSTAGDDQKTCFKLLEDTETVACRAPLRPPNDERKSRVWHARLKAFVARARRDDPLCHAHLR